MKKDPFSSRGRPGEQAASMRERAMALAQKRKEEFLGARVPRELRERIIQRAEQEGLPVSLLIRRILEAYVQGPVPAAAAASPVVGPPAGGPQDVRLQADPRGGSADAPSPVGPYPPAAVPPDRFAHVLGWDKITLNKDVACTSCGLFLKVGSVATLGVGLAGGPPVILCDRCKGLI